MKIIDRLKEYIDTKGISYNSFDKSIGASNGYIGRQIKNKASIGGDILEKIFSIYTELSPDWLIMGKGEMFRTEMSQPVSISSTDFAKVLLDRVEELRVENEDLKRANEKLLEEVNQRSVYIAAEPGNKGTRK